MTHKIYRNLRMLTGVAVLLTTQQASAQKARVLTLDEAIKLSVGHSGQLVISGAKAEEATAVYHQALNNRLPDLKVSGSYLRLNKPSIDLKVKLGSGSGGQQSKPVEVSQAAYGIANASLPLFSGFRIKYGIESAKYLEQAAKLDADNDREGVMENTIEAFGNFYKAKNTVDLVRENLQREQQRVHDFSNLEQNGLLARNDLLKAQLQESNVELSLLDAENNLHMANVNMNLLIGFPENTDLVPDTSLLRRPVDAGKVADWEQSAFDNRKDLASLSFREKAAATAIKSAKGEYYPGIALTGGLIAADIPNLLTISNAMNIGLGLQYNIASFWKTGAKIAQAKARQHETMAMQGILADAIRLQVTKAYEDYLLSVRKIDVYAKAIEQANENFRITKNKFDNNLVTTTDLLDADVAQLQAQMNYAFAKVDAAVAYRKLQQMTGTIK